MVNMLNRQQSHRNEKCQSNATNGSSMNDAETLAPLGRSRHVYVQEDDDCRMKYIIYQSVKKLKSAQTVRYGHFGQINGLHRFKLYKALG